MTSVLIMAGLILFGIGAYMWWPPLAFMFGGVWLIGAGTSVAYVKVKKKKD